MPKGRCYLFTQLYFMDNFLKSISAKLESFLPGAMKTQMAAGYRDGNLKLTERGARALLEIVAETNEDALTAKAQVRVDAQAAKAKSNATSDCSSECTG